MVVVSSGLTVYTIIIYYKDGQAFDEKTYLIMADESVFVSDSPIFRRLAATCC